MNYCQFRNETIKRMANAGSVTPILPPEYQRVEYLQSSSNTYIMTGFCPTQRFVTEIKGAHISMSDETFIGGCYYRIASQSKTGNYGIACNPSRTYFRCSSSADNGSSYTWLDMQMIWGGKLVVVMWPGLDKGCRPAPPAAAGL